MKVILFFVLAPLWVCEAKLNIQGLGNGLRAILGKVSKTVVVKKTLKEIGTRSLKQIEDSFMKQLSLKQKEDEDLDLPIITNDSVAIGKWLEGNGILENNHHSSYPNTWVEIHQFWRTTVGFARLLKWEMDLINKEVYTMKNKLKTTIEGLNQVDDIGGPLLGPVSSTIAEVLHPLQEDISAVMHLTNDRAPFFNLQVDFNDQTRDNISRIEGKVLLIEENIKTWTTILEKEKQDTEKVREEMESATNFKYMKELEAFKKDLEGFKKDLEENKTNDLMQTKYEIGSYLFTACVTATLLIISKLTAFKRKVIEETLDKLDEENK